jgi:hypothetical protein
MEALAALERRQLILREVRMLREIARSVAETGKTLRTLRGAIRHHARLANFPVVIRENPVLVELLAAE